LTDNYTVPEVANRWVDQFKARIPFKAHGFSDRTIKALLAYGIDGPQRLLGMDPRVIRCIPGVGDFCMKEIERYRARFSR
jgi:hypothetical protein